MRETISTNELRLGDVVECFDGAYSSATVKNITDKEVTLFRPYAHHDEFVYSNGLICYTGVETFSVTNTPGTSFVRLQKGHVDNA